MGTFWVYLPDEQRMCVGFFLLFFSTSVEVLVCFMKQVVFSLLAKLEQWTQTWQQVFPAVLLSIRWPPCPGELLASTGTSGIWWTPRNALCVPRRAARPGWAAVCLGCRVADKETFSHQRRIVFQEQIWANVLNPAEVEKTHNRSGFVPCLFALISSDCTVCKWPVSLCSAHHPFEICM